MGVETSAGGALDRRARVLLERLAAGAAPIVFRDRPQHLRELTGLAVGLEFLRRDQIAGLADVGLEDIQLSCSLGSIRARPAGVEDLVRGVARAGKLNRR